MLNLHCVDLSVPRHVKLIPLNSRTVLMQWRPPSRPNGKVTGYTIEWTWKGQKQRSIRLGNRLSHFFTELEPRHIITASVYAHNQPETSVKFEYIGSPSAFIKATTPPAGRG